MDGRRGLSIALLALVGACADSTTPPTTKSTVPVEAASEAARSASVCSAGGGGAAGVPARLDGWADGAKLIDGLGDFHRVATTRSPDAQRWFDQGMRLLWAFNHDEATRAFVKAGTIDPDCAACWWGAGLALGPNYNFPQMPDRAEAAAEALARAQRASSNASPVEHALIDALAKRIPGPQGLDPDAMAPYLEVYATAMDDVQRRFPNDDDVRVMDAEALMTSHAWKLWTLDGQPSPVTPRIRTLLETTLAANPRHPGANHYYIHTMEASSMAAKAVPSGERLAALMPAAGHIVHMPAHVFQRVGRYGDAEKANLDGAAADRAYIATMLPASYYPAYLAHNEDFASLSALMRGRSQAAVDAQRRAGSVAPPSLLDAMPGMDFYAAKTILVETHFARWDAVLAEPEPPAKHLVWSGLSHYARTVAYAATGRLDRARAEKAALDASLAAVPPDMVAGFNNARALLGLASKVADARIALADGRRDAAIASLRDAVAREDKLAYNEPADWMSPVRQQLGAALVAAKRPAEAEAVYREDLRRNPENGWSLYGLAQALKAQRKDASEVERRFAITWKDADIKLASSAL